jgi:flavin-dependent dehydrogenase
MPHVAIIGAGPAGCTAAILLAREPGFRVTLVEQHRFPRDKVCGECLSALGLDVLRRLGMQRAAFQLDPVILTRTTIHACDGSSLSLSLPRPMWGVSRVRFDSVLLDGARTAGARVLQPARCENVNGTLTVRSLASNLLRTIDADVVLVADGKGALLPSRPPPTRDFGIKAHFTGVNGPRDAIELFGMRGCYGGMAAVEGDRWNVAFSVPRSRLRAFGGNLDRMFNETLNENAALGLRLREGTRLTDWLAAPLPRSNVARQFPRNVIPIGNAAAAIEPIGGEGMGLAMRSAEIAGDELIAAHRSGRAPRIDFIRARYGQLWRIRSVACRATAVAVSSPRVARFGICIVPRPVARLAMRLTGKSR